MEIPGMPKKDLAHRLLDWVQENKNLLILMLLGGIGFFGILAGIAAWRQSQEEKALTLFYAAQKGEETEKIEAVIKKYPKTPSGILALANLASKDFENQNWDSCIARYEDLYKKASQPFFRVLALHGKGACLEGKKEYSQAAEIFERAAKEPGHVDSLLSRFEAARSYSLAKDPSAAEKLEGLLKEEKLSPQLKEAIQTELLWIRLQKGS